MPFLAELESTYEHIVFTGTEGDCSNFAKLVKLTVEANELPLRVEYRAGRHGLPNKWLVVTKMLPRVAHTVAALSRGGEHRVTGDEVLQFLRVQEGNLREWIEEVERGLRMTLGKEIPYEPVEPGIEV